VADRLGYRFVDDEVIEQAGEWAELAPAFVADVERRKPLMDRVLGRLVDPTAAPAVPIRPAGRILPGDPELRTLIKQVLVSLADSGSVVIASHAASFALSGRGVLRVLVTASPETRADRLSAARDVDDRAAERLVKREDAGRAEYLKRFYDVERELPTHYDVVVNTDVLTVKGASDLIIAAAG
jgi:hypothetical protein